MKAFLSHTSLDKDLVGLVHQKLISKDAWYDAANIENGQNIPEKINEGLHLATHYVLFWSKRASESNWVRAELNAAFVQMMTNKCKFMIFVLDNTELPVLLQPYKYEYIDKNNLETAAQSIVDKIMALEGAVPRLSEFINRTKELGEIEESVRAGYKLIILNGILGIGKSSLAKKTIEWLYSNRGMKSIIIDFNIIPGIAEMAMNLSYQCKLKLINSNLNEAEQKENIKYFLEHISAGNIVLILKDVKKWLNEDGSMNKDLLFITDIIVNTKMFTYVTIMTTSRYINIPEKYFERTRQLSIQGMEDSHIVQIIQNNLPAYFQIDEKKSLDFAKRLYGYPLGAKLGAYRITNHGYDYYLGQPVKIHELKVSLAKQLISYAELSVECLDYLKIIALCQSRLRNEEYAIAFPELHDNIAELSDKAFFAGVLKYNEDGCYKLELLVEDYFYDLAFSDKDCKSRCNRLESFLTGVVKNKNHDHYMRLVPLAVHIMTLNGNIGNALKLREELTATIVSSMWDLYNHREYEESYKVASQLLEIDNENIEARYVKALCLTRYDEYKNAEEILNELMDDDADNKARYFYALGRIQKRQANYNEAIDLFQAAIINRRKYLSPYRELAECYLLIDKIDDAKDAIKGAKKIDESNIFVTLLEARLLQKENNAQKAIDLLDEQSIIERDPAQILFRKGRAYDQLGNKEMAKECYTKSLEYNPKTYDAKLCLLNHQILDNPQIIKKELEGIKDELRGKRKYILFNIEARFIGYQNHNEDKAIEILDSVPQFFRDKQWYAVKIQMLENLVEKHELSQRVILANAYKTQLEELRDTVMKKYGVYSLEVTDLLPDA